MLDTTKNDGVKAAIKTNVTLSEADRDVSEADATKIDPTNGVVEISKSGKYLFEGNYGGIIATKKELTLHFIFKNAHFTNKNGIAIDCQDKKVDSLIITLADGTTNSVTNDGDDVNAVHIKGGPLTINGKGTLNITSDSKSGIKCGKIIKIVDATLNISAANHGVTGSAVIAQSCAINVTAAGKDGINAEYDEYAPEESVFTDDGFVSLVDVNYTCDVMGDGIQADTVVYIDGGNYNIKTTGEFVSKTADNMKEYDLTTDDFKYTKSGNDYKRIASDETGRYGNNLYALAQGCKGIKVGELEYTVKDDDGNKTTVTLYDAGYLIAIDGGTFNINSTDDAIHANSGDVLITDGTFTIATMDDGVSADNLTKIVGGNITVTSSYEGLEGSYVEITGGTISIVASDDGINAASDDWRVQEHIIISGGDITVDANGDGIDSNGSILIAGGKVVVHGPTTGGDAGLDADKGIVVNGGVLFASSTLGMVETPSSNSEQCVVSYAQNSAISVGSTVALKDNKGNVLIEVEVKKNNCQSIIFSHPFLAMNSKYTIWIAGKKVETFTISSIITSIGVSTQGGFGRPGGGGPNRPDRP